MINSKAIIYSCVFFLIFTAPGLSYSFFYPYHLIIPFIVFFGFLKLNRNNFHVNKIVFMVMCFYFYVVSTFFLLSRYDLYFNYIFYILVSIITLLFAFLYFDPSRNNSDIILRNIKLFLFIYILVGFLEAANIIRMPFSPYSEYYHLFGKSRDLSELNDAAYLYNTQKPTGFSGNPNTYGFCLLTLFPFVFMVKRLVVRFLLIIATYFIIYKIDSKVLFLSSVLALLIYLFVFSKNKILKLYTSGILILMILFYFIKDNVISFSEGRMFQVFDAASKGFMYIFGSENIVDLDSTGQRALIYKMGIERLNDSYYMGIGLSGIESYLKNYFGEHTAFHNFFLMILVDLGVFGFIFILSLYIYLLRNLYLGAKKCLDPVVAKIYQCLFISILLSIIMSIAPSGIIYLLPYWFLIGISLYYCFYIKEFKRI